MADDRFIAKELSKPELQTMETFAPAYFDYMSAAVNAKVCHFICSTLDLTTMTLASDSACENLWML